MYILLYAILLFRIQHIYMSTDKVVYFNPIPLEEYVSFPLLLNG